MDNYFTAMSATSVGRAPAAAARAWTREDDKLFEWALAEWSEDVPNRWAIIAAQLPGGRSAADVWQHYQALVEDLGMIDRGMVEMPDCWGDPEDGDEDREETETSSDGQAQQRGRQKGGDRGGGGGKRKGEERKRGVPWTEDEHLLFLEGLEKYGKGDWRNISRWSVKTRTPTQVASHAQKYFIRQNQNAVTGTGTGTGTGGGHRETKRKSIHDITR